MQHNAPTPARPSDYQVMRATGGPSDATDAHAKRPVADGVTIVGDGTSDRPYSVNVPDILKQTIACLQTVVGDACFHAMQAEGSEYIVAPRYKQIVSLEGRSVFTCRRRGWYFLNLVVHTEDPLDATTLAGTLWTNDNRTGWGQSGHLAHKEVCATEPLYLCHFCELIDGQDVWCTLWHDAGSPIKTRSIDFIVLPFGQKLDRI